MRINRFVALATGMSRRAADQALAKGRIRVNGEPPPAGYQVQPSDTVTLDNGRITTAVKTITIMLNKPAGYVSSRRRQGSKTIYDLLPHNLHALKPVGRLDKDSSGLLLMTNDGKLAHELTHPSFQKDKLYTVTLDKPLSSKDKARIKQGVMLEDGISTFTNVSLISDFQLWVSLHEGRNRQIRRTFAALGYKVIALHRTQFGPYKLKELALGKYTYL